MPININAVDFFQLGISMVSNFNFEKYRKGNIFLLKEINLIFGYQMALPNHAITGSVHLWSKQKEDLNPEDANIYK